MDSMRRSFFVAGLLVIAAALLVSAYVGLTLALTRDRPAADTTPRPGSGRTYLPRLLPGVQPGGEVQLPNQWSLRPAGRQIVVGDFPVNLALHPDGQWLAILHAGFGEHEVIILDLKAQKKTSRFL